jgi:hypothetical protein
MTLVERSKHLRLIQSRYPRSSRPERTALPTEAEQVTYLDRKTLIPRQHGNLTRKSRRRQRGRTYGREVEAAVRLVAETLDSPCAERLQPTWLSTMSWTSARGFLTSWAASVSQPPPACSGISAAIIPVSPPAPGADQLAPRHVSAGRIAGCQADLGTSKRTSSAMPAHPLPACMATPSSW